MKGVRILLVLVILGAAGAGGWYWWTTHQAASDGTGASRSAQGAGAGGGRGRQARFDAGGAIPVIVAPVKVETVPVYRDGIGNVQAYAMVTIRTQVDGRLLSVNFKEGQTVQKGDILARIDPVTYQAQLDQAVAKKAQDQANLANARIDLERYDKLAATNAGSKQQADAQRALVAQLEAQVRSDDGAIDNARAYLNYTTIASPIDGVTGLRQVDAGNIIHSSDTNGLVTITQIKPIAVVFTLPQRDLQIVSEAMRAGAVKATAMEADGRILGEGQLEVIDNQVDATTGTIKFKAAFPNDRQTLWPGQFVNVRLQVKTLTDVDVVPTPAIRRGPQGTFVYRLDGDKVRVTPVTVLQQDEALSVLSKGAEAGMKVVTTGFTRLSDGRTVTVTETPDGGEAPRAAEARRPRGENGQRGEGGGRRRREGAAGNAAAPAPAAPASEAAQPPTREGG